MNIMVFCSNPVNGGTARMFVEFVKGLRKRLNCNVVACVNEDNEALVYKEIKDLCFLPVMSEEKLVLGEVSSKILGKLANVFYRWWRYRPIKKKNIKLFESALCQWRIDVVIVHNGGYVGDDLCNQLLEAAYNMRDIVSKRICVFHCDMEKSFFQRLRYFGYDYKISRIVTDLVTVSKFTKDRILSSSFIQKEVYVIPNGLDVKANYETLYSNQRINVDRKKKNILMIGNISSNKGHVYFLEMARLLLQIDNAYRFTIIGNVYDNNYYLQCQNVIERLDLEDYIQIVGGVNNASEKIAMFDVLVVPSVEDESFGLVSVEAMAYGVPVVAFYCGGIPEVLIDGVNGYLVETRNVQNLAEKVHSIVSNNSLKEAMKNNNIRDYNNRFSVDAMMTEYLKIIIKE